MKKEQQLSMLLPITNERGYRERSPTKENNLEKPTAAADKRHLQIKQSLKNKGLLKSNHS
ncbi:hypothetical protein [Rhizobium sp. BK491]|uniref:hypothetical protein n=1 Tax=Rhizobium sp. BK491 TaxID=2587009 RepID=UPI00160C4C52|nr:hypothetical protein [Rhizobium sp. BK491]MBB3566496.1 hypothetical protein [Rhizobium sp. BK491]